MRRSQGVRILAGWVVQRRVWVPETLHMSCDVLIFVEEAADAVAPADLVGPCWRAAGEWS